MNIDDYSPSHNINGSLKLTYSIIFYSGQYSTVDCSHESNKHIPFSCSTNEVLMIIYSDLKITWPKLVNRNRESIKVKLGTWYERVS
jgi:hypothetical protein